jgi:hypothetical protein
MNILTLKGFDNGQVVYEYQPEGKGKTGEVLFDISHKRGELRRKAETDSAEGLYGQKALLKVEELVQKNNIPLKCTQAWY